MRCSRSSSSETEEQKASRLALSRQCKEKTQEKRDEDTPKKDDNEEPSTSPPVNTFRNIAQDIHQAVKEDLEGEGVTDKVTNSQLRQCIEKLLKAVFGMKTVSKSKVDDVLFLSESETEKKSDSSENEKMQSDADKTPEPKLTSHDVCENDGGDRSESDVSKTLDGSRKSEDSHESEPIPDMLFYLYEDDIELLDNLSDINQLKVFDAVNKMKNLPGYKPEKADESLCDIVTKSVGLMKILSVDGKLDENEV